MSNNIFEKMTNQLTETIDSSVALAMHNKNQEVEMIHLLWALLTNTNSVLNQLLNKMNVNKAAVELEAKSHASKLPSVSSVTKENIKLSRNLLASLQKAEGLMTSFGDKFIAIDTWLISNFDSQVLKDVLGKYIDLREAKKELEAMRAGNKIDSASGDENLEALGKYGIDLNKKAIDGPLVVAGTILLENIEGLNDSKILSEKKREKLFDEIKDKSKYHIVFSSAKTIDEIGLSACLKNSITEIMQILKPHCNEFLMDGNTSFGIESLKWKIKADATVPQVSAASILAKVSRDRYMYEISKRFSNYNFAKHKGYGTKAHIEAIKKFGRSDEHRFTFKLKALNESEDFNNKINNQSIFNF